MNASATYPQQASPREPQRKGPRYHLVDVEDGRSIRLRKGRVRLVSRDDPAATVFNARQAMRWMQQHPERACAAVAIGGEETGRKVGA